MIILCIVHSFRLSLICGNKFWRNRVLVSHAALTAFTLGYILYLPFCSLIVSAYLSWFWRRSYISVTLSSLCIPTHLQRLLVFLACLLPCHRISLQMQLSRLLCFFRLYFVSCLILTASETSALIQEMIGNYLQMSSYA